MSTIGRNICFPFFLLALLFAGFFASGQVKFTTVVNSQDIGRGDYLQIEFYVENAREIDQMTPPDFQGFQIVQGPIQSSGMSIVNGNMSQYKSLSFVLQPVKTGKFTIGGASATVDGKHMQSNSVTIRVSASSTGAGGGSGSNSRPVNPFPSLNWPSDPMGGASSDVEKDIVLKPGENVKDKIRKNLFLKVQVDKTTCYVGEPIVASYKLYSRLSFDPKITKRPSLNGFSVYDMGDPNTQMPSVERLNGKAYTVITLRKTQLIPLQPGTVDLDPLEMENTVHFVRGSKQQDVQHGGNSLKNIFDQLALDELGPEVDENVIMDTKPVPITVKPLPEEHKPAGFNGAVGNFSIQASLANRNITSQDEATLHVIIRGKGNLPVITAPQIAWPAGIEAFDPSAKEDINKTVSPMSGSKTFDFTFTTRDPGHYVIPAINFPYFDPATQSYKTAGTEPLDFQVMPGVKKKPASPGTIASAPASGQEEITNLKKLVQDHLEWIFAVLILSFVAVYLWRQNLRLRKTEQEQKQADAEAAAEKLLEEKARQSLPAAAYTSTMPVTDPLAEVRQLFEQGDYKGFYRELNRGIWKALSKKLELPASELNKLNITRQLESRGWDRGNILSLESILNECEMNLYTPAYDRYNMQLLLRQAESVMGMLA